MFGADSSLFVWRGVQIWGAWGGGAWWCYEIVALNWISKKIVCLRGVAFHGSGC